MRKYTLDQLKIAVASSNSFTEVCEFIGICRRGNSYQIMRRLVKENNIDYSHFPDPILYGLAVSKISDKKHWSEILVSGHKDRIHSYLIRRALIESGIDYICKICGQLPFWNNEELVLQVDHIDGNRTNSIQSNLRFLCPNCHTQQLNKSLGHKCENCNKKITNKARWCLVCQHQFRIKKRKVDRPSLEILLNDVEKLGYRATGRKYGVSDNAVRKWIKSMTNKLT